MKRPNRLESQSADNVQLNIDALYKIAPSCFTEVPDNQTGGVKLAIDFKKLRQLLGDAAVEDAPEAYEFTWVGKQAARREAAQSIHKTLRPVPEDSVDWDNTQNLYIEGDNLEALKLLQKSYLGKVKMIYIDPPYNTGNDFVYHDEFKVSQSEYNEVAGYVDEEGNRLVSRGNSGATASLNDAFKKNTDSNGRFHSDWCSMIYSRLMIARSLLTEDGVIFISIDDNEVENLRKVCDEVFGESNFVSEFIWEKKKKPSFLNINIGTKTEYIIAYSKNRSILGALSVDRTEEGKKYPINNAGNALAKLTFQAHKVRFNMDDCLVTAQDMSEGNIKTTLMNDFHISNGYNEEPFTLLGEWRYSQETLDEIIKNGDEIVISKIPFRPNHIKKGGELKKMHNLLTLSLYPQVGTNEDATSEIYQLLQGNYFDYSKPSSLIHFLIKSCTYNSKDSLILDFFSGSATTAHAVMQLNAEDGGNRRFIMVQLPEETAEDSEAYKAGYKNICEIGKERIRRAGAKIKEELVSKNKKQEGGFFDKEEEEDNAASTLDTGFRVFRIDSGNMKEDLEQAPSEVEQTKLDFYIDNVKEDRNELDLLFGCMLNWGVQLSLPMSMETVDGCNIYTVNEGDLVACLTKDKPVTENIVRAIAEKSPLRVLFRDGSFASDAAKINIFEQFKQLMDWSDEEIIKNVRVL